LVGGSPFIRGFWILTLKVSCDNEHYFSAQIIFLFDRIRNIIRHHVEDFYFI